MKMFLSRMAKLNWGSGVSETRGSIAGGGEEGKRYDVSICVILQDKSDVGKRGNILVAGDERSGIYPGICGADF